MCDVSRFPTDSNGEVRRHKADFIHSSPTHCGNRREQFETETKASSALATLCQFVRIWHQLLKVRLRNIGSLNFDTLLRVLALKALLFRQITDRYFEPEAQNFRAEYLSFSRQFQSVCHSMRRRPSRIPSIKLPHSCCLLFLKVRAVLPLHQSTTIFQVYTRRQKL